jgi:hypothetical protein
VEARRFPIDASTKKPIHIWSDRTYVIMARYLRILPTYEAVEKYIKEGLPEGHFNREMVDEEGDGHPVYIDGGRYDNLPPDIQYSARFMEGLTADSEVYPQFLEDFVGPENSSSGGVWWHEKFVHHARIVFKHWNASERECTATVHKNITVLSTTTTSGHKLAICQDTWIDTLFYDMVMLEIVGMQSQTLMRDKFFCVLSLEARKLPKSKPTATSATKPENLVKWIHALQLVAKVFVRNIDWLSFKFYSESDLDYLFNDLYHRVQHTLTALKAGGAYNSEDGSRMLIHILSDLNMIEEEYVGAFKDCVETPRRQYLFTKLIKKWSEEADAIYRLYNDSQGLKPLKLEVIEEEEEEEEEEKEA